MRISFVSHSFIHFFVDFIAVEMPEVAGVLVNAPFTFVTFAAICEENLLLEKLNEVTFCRNNYERRSIFPESVTRKFSGNINVARNLWRIY